MRAYKIILSSNYSNDAQADNTFFFRIEFAEIFQDNAVFELAEFTKNFNDKIELVQKELENIILKMTENFNENLSLTSNKIEVWKNNYQDIIFSIRGKISNISKSQMMDKINVIKNDLLSNDIFLRINSNW
jgi:NAD+--asparagine ADP-ribosyltransferase